MARAAEMLERLVDEAFLFEQVVAGGGRLGDVLRAAPRLRRRKARGRTIYDKARGAAPLVAEALRRATAEPEPKRRRPGRVLLALLGVGLGAVAFYFAWRRDQTHPDGEGGQASAPQPTTSITTESSPT